jgi:hypothetical protein
MTAQISDMFRYQEKEYLIVGIDEGKLFDISALNLKPSWPSTACWRGYQAVFAINQSRLVLDALHVHLRRPGEGKNQHEREVGPVINGVAPSPSVKNCPWEDLISFNNHYEGLNHHLEYSGGLLLANWFNQSLCIYPVWKYKTVIELIFEAGLLKQEFDRSERMAEIREIVDKYQEMDSSNRIPLNEEIKLFVERAFDCSYRSYEKTLIKWITPR